MTFPFLLFRFIRYAGRLSLSRSQSCRSNSAEHPFSTAALGIGQVVWEKQGEAAGASQDSGVCSVHMSAWFLRLVFEHFAVHRYHYRHCSALTLQDASV